MRRMILVAASVLVVPGCMLFFMQRARDATVTKAENPLHEGGTGGSLVATSPSREGTLRTIANARDCNIWPVGDRYTVELTSEKVCITYEASESARAGGSTPRRDHEARSMTASAGGAAWTISLLPEDAISKVAQCSKPSGDMQGTYDVWVQRYSGCTENAGRVDGASAKLTVDDDVTWAFGP